MYSSMKTKEELNELKQEYKILSEKLHELNEIELNEVIGGVQLGEEMTIRIRGGSSLNSSGNPLFIIDGQPTEE